MHLYLNSPRYDCDIVESLNCLLFISLFLVYLLAWPLFSDLVHSFEVACVCACVRAGVCVFVISCEFIDNIFTFLQHTEYILVTSPT